MDSTRLLSVAAPHLHLLTATPSDACNIAWSLQRTQPRRHVARVLRAAKARTAARLFDEFAAALQFPDYFGENWDALDECLCDLEWLPGDAYVLFFTDSHRLLDREPADQLALLLDVLEHCGREWARSDTRGPLRPPTPFHAVFQCPESEKAAFCGRVRAVQRALNELT